MPDVSTIRRVTSLRGLAVFRDNPSFRFLLAGIGNERAKSTCRRIVGSLDQSTETSQDHTLSGTARSEGLDGGPRRPNRVRRC